MAKIQNAPMMTYGISTSVLFDMSKEDALFHKNPQAYKDYMIENADKPLDIRLGFTFLQNVIQHPDMFKIVLISRNSPLTAIRAIRTLANEGIAPAQFLFTNGRSPVPYLNVYGLDRFITTNADDFENAQKSGIPSTLHGHQIIGDPANNKIVMPPKMRIPVHDIVFDIDGVLVDPTSEAFYQQHGLDAYKKMEESLLNQHLKEGPFFPYLKKASEVNAQHEDKEILLSIATLRGGFAGIRALYTLYEWGYDFNGIVNCGDGDNKQNILTAIRTEDEKLGITTEFIDDQDHNVERGHNAGAFSGKAHSTIFGPNGP